MQVKPTSSISLAAFQALQFIFWWILAENRLNLAFKPKTYAKTAILSSQSLKKLQSYAEVSNQWKSFLCLYLLFCGTAKKHCFVRPFGRIPSSPTGYWEQKSRASGAAMIMCAFCISGSSPEVGGEFTAMIMCAFWISGSSPEVGGGVYSNNFSCFMLSA